MADQPSSPDPRIGSTLQGRYKILARIASGAMGVVYKGERLQLGRPVAIKFLHPWIAAQKTFLTRFENEARAMSRLAHPNCVTVIDFGVEGAPYLVMDFVTGRTLREVLEQGRMPVARSLNVIRQLLSGLAHAHAQGIVHRDLKPENMVLSDEAGMQDHLRILDFGLAKLRDGPAMTTGLAIGTPSYMSPEQTGAQGTIDARADVYAVGVLLYELLAGQKPFRSENVGELLLMHREMPAPRIREDVPDAGLSAEIEEVILKAMAKNPEDRFQSAAEFVAAFDQTPEGKMSRGGVVAGVISAAPTAPAGSSHPNAARPAPAAPRPAPVASPPVPTNHVASPAAAAPLPPPRVGGDRAPVPRPAPIPADATVVESPSVIQRLMDLPGARTVVSMPSPDVERPGADASPPPAAAVPSQDGAAAAPAQAAAPNGGPRLPKLKLPKLPKLALPKNLDRRHYLIGGGVLGAVAIALLLWIPLRNDDTALPAPSAPTPVGGVLGGGSAAPAQPAPAGAPWGEPGSRMADAERLYRAGEWEQAVVVLTKVRREEPDNPLAPYLLATIYFEYRRWGEGVSAAQAAISRNPAYKSDPALAEGLIRSLVSDRSYDRSQALLRSMMPSATPNIREAARHDPSPKVRERASEILQGGRSGWGSSRSSGRSAFSR